MSMLKLHGAEVKPVTAAEFFATVCPAVLGAKEADCKKMGGRYGFELSGDGGGAWTIDYTQATVRDGATDDVDLSLHMSAGDFSRMMQGTLDVSAAALAGHIRVRGNTALFSNLIAVLEPPSAA